MSKFMENGWCNTCKWTGRPGSEHECIEPGDPRYSIEYVDRLYRLAKEGPGPRDPLTAEDIKALRWCLRALGEARHASSKIWSMLIRGEVVPKAELDGLLSAFHERPWWHVKTSDGPCMCEQCRRWDEEKREDRERRDREREVAP